jgi:hypothetical protein
VVPEAPMHWGGRNIASRPPLGPTHTLI